MPTIDLNTAQALAASGHFVPTQLSSLNPYNKKVEEMAEATDPLPADALAYLVENPDSGSSTDHRVDISRLTEKPGQGDVKVSVDGSGDSTIENLTPARLLQMLATGDMVLSAGTSMTVQTTAGGDIALSITGGSGDISLNAGATGSIFHNALTILSSLATLVSYKLAQVAAKLISIQKQATPADPTDTDEMPIWAEVLGSQAFPNFKWHDGSTWIRDVIAPAFDTGVILAAVSFEGRDTSGLATIIRSKNVTSVEADAGASTYDIQMTSDTWAGLNLEGQIDVRATVFETPSVDTTNHLEFFDYVPGTDIITLISGERNKNGQWSDDMFGGSTLVVVVTAFADGGQIR